MQAHVCPSAPENASEARRRYRHEARFIPDWREHCRPLDRNQRAKIVFLAEALERRTKPKGRKNGVLGEIGLKILRALVFGFLNSKTGMLCPSYQALRERTGVCNGSIASGLARLEQAGILAIARRLVRRAVDRLSPITGLAERITTTVQATSLYRLHAPGGWAEHLRPAGGRTRFPDRRQLSLLERMQLSWKTSLHLEPSPRSREEPAPTGAQKLSDLLGAG